MKRVFLLIALVATVFASNACGKKDDTKPQEQPKNSLEQKLIGKWKHLFIVALDANNNELKKENVECHHYEFLENGKANLLDYYNSKAECIEAKEYESKTPIFWTLKGNDLSINFDNDHKMPFIIVNLKEHSLEIERPIHSSEIGDYPNKTSKIRWIFQK